MLPKRRVVFDEPNVSLIDGGSGQARFSGAAAIAKQSRLASNEKLVWGFRNGVIADYVATQAVLRSALRQTLPRWMMTKPDAIVSLAGVASSTERRAWLDVLEEVGFRQVYLLPAAQATALGAGLDITQPHGSLVVQMGAGCMEVALFSMGQALHKAELRFGGHTLDETIQRRVQRLHGIQITIAEARRLKERQLNIAPLQAMASIPIKGTVVGKKETRKVMLKNESLVPTLETFFEPLIRGLKQVIEASSPELISDVIDDGIILSGGLAQLTGLNRYISKKLKVSCVLAAEPTLSVLRGLNVAATHAQDFRRTLD